jgi:hypothetical protein
VAHVREQAAAGTIKLAKLVGFDALDVETVFQPKTIHLGASCTIQRCEREHAVERACPPRAPPRRKDQDGE